MPHRSSGAEAALATGKRAVHTDAGGVLVVGDDGEVLHYDPETRTTSPVTDGWRTLALVKAAKQYPELAHLRPQRPDGAIDCPQCGGTGVFLDVDCGRCFTTGWVA